MNKIMLQFYSPHGETEKYAGNGIKQQEHEYNRTIRMFQYFCSLKMNTDSYQYTKARMHYQHRWKEIPALSTIQILKGFPCRTSLIVQTPTFRIAVTRETEINKNRKHFVNQASQWIQFDRPIIFMDSFKRHCFSYTSS